jgi:azurin
MQGMTMKFLYYGSLLLVLGSSNLYADACELDISVGDNMNFVPAALTVSATACKTVAINLKHTGTLPRNAMGHNWVLSATENAQATAQDGWAAGLQNQYLKPEDSRIIAGTKIIGGGESDSVSFNISDLKVGGDYTFFCSFIGHFAIMQGKFTITE